MFHWHPSDLVDGFAGGGPTARLHRRQGTRCRRLAPARRERHRRRAEHRLHPHCRHRGDRRVLDPQSRARRLYRDRRNVRLCVVAAIGSAADRRVERPARFQHAGCRRHRRCPGHGSGAARRNQQQPDRRLALGPGDRGRAVELPQFHGADAVDSRHHAQPRRIDVRGRPGGRQRHAVTAERLPARRHVQQRRPSGRQPGHAGPGGPRQHRRIPGVVEFVQRRIRRRRPSRRNGRCNRDSGWADRCSATAPTSTSRSSATARKSPASSASRPRPRRSRPT